MTSQFKLRKLSIKGLEGFTVWQTRSLEVDSVVVLAPYVYDFCLDHSVYVWCGFSGCEVVLVLSIS